MEGLRRGTFSGQFVVQQFLTWAVVWGPRGGVVWRPVSGPSSEEVAGFGKEVQDLLGGDGWDVTGLESRKCREEGFW